jgi:hypothetical protein
MPRYIVERTFPDGLAIPTTAEGVEALDTVIQNNATDQVTWVQSFVTRDRHKTFCVYDAPSPEAVRKAADRSGLPIDSISDVTVLDPYFYLGASG